MMPFGNQLPADVNIDDNELVRIEAMIQSMTLQERRQPDLVQQQVTRQRRIARGPAPGRGGKGSPRPLQHDEGHARLLGGGMGGGFLNNLPGFKQLNAMRQMKNMNMGALLNDMGGGLSSGPGGGMPGGFPGMPGGFPGMPGMPQPGQPTLPKGFNMPGQRATSDRTATKAKIDREKARRKRKNARKSRKKR